ncbi:MAG: hypothetical protein WAX77_11595 [Methylococcaceae bacterium]
MELKKHYIVDEHNHKIAVQLDIKTFNKIETILEDYALVQLMNADDSEHLSLDDAKQYYASLNADEQVLQIHKQLMNDYSEVFEKLAQ